MAPQAAEFIHFHTPHEGFLYDLVAAVSKHGTSIEDIISLFYQCSNNVHVEKMDNGEFDYLVYFEDGIPDDYRYCLKDEGCHVIYHRFTEDDYNDNFS